ncbi:zinc finger protein CONSTANS-LIKE 2-like [Euphorbia lathyris]|uniref:zinc finger protein CONSTANS-LIKE 2-like n=1 Tax=Euphorbia lathyris TaxID=212925 RepID=UPI003313F681
MMKKENTGDGDTGTGNNNWARVCDACRAAACTVYCKADSAYLCSSCDARIHAANRLASQHERVWVCEACERAPANFLCKADAASLCSACDASIHSANPLARRHQRVPILPIAGNFYGERSNEELFVNMEDGEEDETASWLVLNNQVKKDNINEMLFGGDTDEYLDLVEYNSNSCGENEYNQEYDFGYKNYGDESVVPVQCEEEGGKDHEYYNFQLGFDFETSKSCYSSTNHGVPVSSMDVGMVSDSTMELEEVSNMSQYSRPPKGTIDLFSNPSIEMSTLLSPRDREARVLRYREKKKTRKFEKTIRYASRKAYAETRPRIKGRFAKRSTDTDADVDVEVDHMFAETGYGIVPGF